MSVSKASLRGLRMKERMEKLREAQQVKVVKVTPKNDDIRRVLVHPKGRGFPGSGPALWPDDRFTQRRLRDGDISLEVEEQSSGERGGGRNAHHRREVAREAE